MVSAMMEHAERAKDVAGQAAAQMVEDGMKLGLGSGSTFLRFLEHLAARVRDEGLDVVGVPSSTAAVVGAALGGGPPPFPPGNRLLLL